MFESFYFLMDEIYSLHKIRFRLLEVPGKKKWLMLALFYYLGVIFLMGVLFGLCCWPPKIDSFVAMYARLVFGDWPHVPCALFTLNYGNNVLFMFSYGCGRLKDVDD